MHPRRNNVVRVRFSELKKLIKEAVEEAMADASVDELDELELEGDLDEGGWGDDTDEPASNGGSGYGGGSGHSKGSSYGEPEKYEFKKDTEEYKGSY